MAKHNTNVDNEELNAPVEIFRAEVLVNKQSLRQVGIQKGTSAEVKVYERGYGNTKRVVHMVTGRHGQAILVQEDHFKRYTFDDVDLTDDDRAEMFNHAG